MKTVIINLQEGEIQRSQEVRVNSIIPLDASFVDMATYMNESQLGVLIQLHHHQPITTLNLRDVTPYVILFFDDACIYKGAAHSIKSGTGNFSLQTQYKNLLFVRLPHDLKLNQIINLKF
jgi:hypothetical protein